MKIPTEILIGVLIAITANSHAQIIEKKSLNLDGAKKAIAAAVAYAKKNHAPRGVFGQRDGMAVDGCLQGLREPPARAWSGGNPYSRYGCGLRGRWISHSGD